MENFSTQLSPPCSPLQSCREHPLTQCLDSRAGGWLPPLTQSSSCSSDETLQDELQNGEVLFEKFLTQIRCYGVRHSSASICLEELACFVNGCVSRRLRTSSEDEDASLKPLMNSAEKKLRFVGKRFYESLKGSDGKSKYFLFSDIFECFILVRSAGPSIYDQFLANAQH